MKRAESDFMKHYHSLPWMQLPMVRSLLPFILASLGSVIVLWATSMPLFDWHISQIVTDFPSTYEIHIAPSPWITRLGNSLDDSSYISLGKIFVSEDGISCSHKDLNFVVKRSSKDKALERLVLTFTEKNSPWLYVWGARIIILSGIYFWWLTIFYEHRSIFPTAVFAVMAVIFYVGLTQLVRPHLLRIVPLEYLGMLNCYHGLVTFNATLSKVHFETVIVFFAGLLFELGALGMMLHQVVTVISQRNKTSN